MANFTSSGFSRSERSAKAFRSLSVHDIVFWVLPSASSCRARAWSCGICFRKWLVLLLIWMVLLEIPATAGIVGVLLAPWLAALGAIAALATNCRIVVERRE